MAGTERDRDKTVAAIMAGVSAYLEEEQAVRRRAVEVKPVAGASLWALSGRQEMMRMRTLWQRRIVG